MYGFGSGGGSLRQLKQKIFSVDNSNYTNGQNQEKINNITATKIINLNNFINPDIFFYKIGFSSLSDLQTTIPSPDIGDIAYTKDTHTLYICEVQGAWQSYALSTEAKQYVDDNFYNKIQADYQTIKNIGFYVSDVFYSFYIDNGNIIFDNGSNTINKDSWVVCAQGGTVNGQTFNKDYLYRITNDTSAPDENSFSDVLSVNNIHIAFFSRNFEVNGSVVYIRGAYVPNNSRTQLELIVSQPGIIYFDFTPVLGTTNQYTISGSALLLKQNYYNFSNHNSSSVVNIPIYTSSLDGKEIILQNAGPSALRFSVGGEIGTVNPPTQNIDSLYVTLKYIDNTININ